MSFVSSKHHFVSFMATSLTVTVYMCHKWQWICTFCLKHLPVHSSIMTYHQFVTRLTRRLPLVEQELSTLPEHLNGIRLARSFCVVLCGSWFVLLSFTFGHYGVCPSIYGLWLPFGIFKLFFNNTRQLPLVEQEVSTNTLPVHLNSLSVFIGVRVARTLVFCMVFCGSLLCFCSFVLAVPRFTDADYPFDIFKLYLTIGKYQQTNKQN
jgi:hypothetical protein